MWLARAVLLHQQVFLPRHQLCWSFIAKKLLLKTICFLLLCEGLTCSHLSPALSPWCIPGGVSVSFQQPNPWNQSSFDSCSLVSTALQFWGRCAFWGCDLYWTDSLTVCCTLPAEHKVRRHSLTFPVFEAMQSHLVSHALSLLACVLCEIPLPGNYPSWLWPSQKTEILLFPLVFASDSQTCTLAVFLT